MFLNTFAAIGAAPRTRPLILSLGVIDARKGHHLTLAAFAQVHAALPGAKLVIAGALKDAQYHRQLRDQIAALHLDDCATIRTDSAQGEILQWLAEAKIFALHSREESQGIALCEALAAGVPVVATRVGGIAQVVTEHEDGLLTEYGDVAAFAAAMQKLLQDDALYSSMAARARAHARRFDWSEITPKIIAVYQSAMGW